jgi:hypothetical protein
MNPDTSPLTGGGNLRLILAVGGAGLLISWVIFFDWIAAHGASLASGGAFWSVALTQQGISGLTWDLIASGVITCAFAWRRRASLGGRGVALVICLTWTLGVCVGLAALFGVDAYRQRQLAP